MNNERNADIWFRASIVAIGLVLFGRSFFLPKFDWDPVGMAFWPRVLIFVLLFLIFWLSVERRGWSTANGLEAPLRLGFALPLLGIIYAISLEFIGFLLLTPPLLFVLSYGWMKAGNYRALWSLAVASGGILLVFLVFELGVQVELPRGLLG